MVNSWNVRTPVIYRYMEEKYVDAFFKTGSLRLSSFANFISSNHAERFDSEEGKTHLIAKTEQLGGQQISCWHKCGDDAFVLCGSTEYNMKMKGSFDEACIQINNSIAFANEIAKCIPDFITGLEGLCLYQNKKIIEKDIGYLPVEQLRSKEDPSKLNEPLLRQWLYVVGGNDVYFLKPLRYIHQREYRFIWRTSKKIDSALVIECPEARKFCQRPSIWAGTDLSIDGFPRCLPPVRSDSVLRLNARDAKVASFPQNWQRRHAICFPPANSELKDFSLFIKREAFIDEVCEPQGPLSAQEDGGDIRFSLDKAGLKQLPADIIKFEHDSHPRQRNADIQIRVKVPFVPSEQGLTLFVWYHADRKVVQPLHCHPFGRFHAYDINWDAYHPDIKENRLHSRNAQN